MYVPLASRVETRMSVGDLVDRRNFGAQFSFLSGPSEHRGAVGICPNQILSSALTLFQPGADYAHHTAILLNATIKISTCKGSLIVRSCCVFLKNQERTKSICKMFEAGKLARQLGSGDTDSR